MRSARVSDPAGRVTEGLPEARWCENPFSHPSFDGNPFPSPSLIRIGIVGSYYDRA